MEKQWGPRGTPFAEWLVSGQDHKQNIVLSVYTYISVCIQELAQSSRFNNQG